VGGGCTAGRGRALPPTVRTPPAGVRPDGLVSARSAGRHPAASLRVAVSAGLRPR
jgi:hypothetical protein